MDCKHWRSKELMPVAHSLADILMKEPNVSGVAITGSVARYESHVHDIDLIVFQNGNRANASCAHDSVVERYSSGYGGPERNLVQVLKELVAEQAFLRLSEARREIPVHYVFVNEKILWDCDYLQSFLPRAGEMGFFARMGLRFRGAIKAAEDRAKDEFYSTVFCEIPLLLIDPVNVRGAVLEHAISTSGVYMGAFRSTVPISHQCNEMLCKPSEQWAERRWKVKERQGYTCITEERKRREAAKGGLSVPIDDSGALSYPQVGGEVSLVNSDEST